MSLAAAVLVGASAFAIDNVKVSGDAKLYYHTTDNEYGVAGVKTDGSLFDKKTSAGQAAVGLGASADLATGISAGAHMTALSTLGLEGQLVNNVWEGTNGVTDTYWFDEAWIAGTAGKTTAKVGRMALDTPLVFTETWSIAKNTFEAAVVINQDLPDTTLVGAYVGGSNAYSAVNTAYNGHGNPAPAVGIANRIQTSADGAGSSDASNFSQFYNGAFAVGVVNNSVKPLTLQAWYYDAPQAVKAYWLQADLNMEGVLAGAQYSGIDYTKNAQLPIAKDASNDVYALMLGYEMKDTFTAKVAYSQTGTEKDSTLGLGAGANLATLGNAAQSKLYTEAWWNYAYVTRADTSAINVTVEVPVKDVADFGVYYTSSSTDNNGGTQSKVDMNELTLTVGKSFGPLDATLAYIYTKADDLNQKSLANKGDAFNTIQAYLTLNF